MIKEKFKIGDIVELKSGGPEMTISENVYILNIETTNFDLFEGFVICQWFEKEKLQTGKFNQETLDLLDDE